MTTDLIHRLRAYRAHDATADALMEEAARTIEALEAAVAQQRTALETALPVLERHEPCGYYCDEAIGHVDHPATHAVRHALHEQPLGKEMLLAFDCLNAELDTALVVVKAARAIHDRNVSGFRVSTGIIDALAAYDIFVGRAAREG